MRGNVLITGVSSGIGLEIAKVFAKNGYNIIGVSRKSSRLYELKKLIEDTYNVKFILFEKDLNHKEDLYNLTKEVVLNNIQVDILINNAGLGYVNEFISEDYLNDTEIINVNIRALTYLSKFFGKIMAKRKCGIILNVASTGSYTPGPYTSVYYASKAYVLSFSRAISLELKPYNVDVLTLCPGATKTSFSEKCGRKVNPLARSASYVAIKAYNGIKKRKKIIIPGIENKLLVMIPSNISILINSLYQRNLKK